MRISLRTPPGPTWNGPWRIYALQARSLLTPFGRSEFHELERLIRPSGYFRQKAKRLKTFVAFLDQKVRRLPGKDVFRADHKVARRTTQPERRWPGNRGLDSPVRRKSPSFRRGRVYTAHTGSPRNRPGEVRLRRDSRSLPRMRLTLVRAENSESVSNCARTGFRGASHAPSAMSTAKRTALVQVYNEMHGLIVGVGKNHCGKSS